jgi:hypothetical protein
MKLNLKIVLVSLAVIGFVGCGSSSSSPNVSAKDLKGGWIGTCDTNGTNSNRTDLNFVDNRVEIRDIKFNNPTCSEDNKIFYDVTKNFQYLLGEDMTTPNGSDVTKIDMTFLGLLGIAVGDYVDDIKLGTHLYSIVYEKDNKLYFGEISKTDNVNKVDFTHPFSEK